MKGVKRCLAMLLAVALMLGLVPAEAFAANNHSVVVNYVFEDGTPAATAWSASIAPGEDLNDTLTHPTVTGYEPTRYVAGEGVGVTWSDKEITIDVKNIQQDIVVNVFYGPALVDYTIKYYQQNVDNDNYTLANTSVAQARTGSYATVPGKVPEGFYELPYDKEVAVAADGSTVLEVYYDRDYYLMTFDLAGGYGVEPVYARYGASVGEVGTPTRPGYTFAGWVDENGNKVTSIPATMPAENVEYTATWTPGTTSYTVVFWYENANDTNYSYAGSTTVEGVAPGTEVTSATHRSTNFTGKDSTHFTYNADKAETVTVEGDGSTVLNVYFTRNTYTLTFKTKVLECGNTAHAHEDSCRVCGKTAHSHNIGCILGCTKEEHSHEAACYSCGKTEHSHSYNCYGNEQTVKTITAKYQADIINNFPIIGTNNANYLGYWWQVPLGATSLEAGNYIVSLDTMPGENLTFDGTYKGVNAKIYYHVETLGNSAGATTYEGKNFNLYKTVTTVKSGNLTYEEEFHPITGFTRWKSNPDFTVDSTPSTQESNYMYYSRNSYTLKFYNVNAYVTDKETTVQYQASLSDKNFTPSYPANLEAGAYEFEGWYTSPGCYEGSKFNFSEGTMPANDMVLYANWVPVTHTVEVYITDDLKIQIGSAQEAAHGSVAVEPKEPENGQYEFVGWFYMDNGVEKAFDFASMPIRKDMVIYAKWSSKVLVPYTVSYKLKDTDIVIAGETTGNALAGTTKTFEAKGGEELFADYQVGYFPTTTSHSMTFDIEGNNVFVFEYVQKDAVPYTVKYLDKATGEPVADEVTYPENRHAIVTETAVNVSGYVPEKYQQRLVVSAEDGAVNEIIFYYNEDSKHALVTDYHYLVNGKVETEYSHSQITGDIGKEYTRINIEDGKIGKYIFDHVEVVIGNITETYTAAQIAADSSVLTKVLTANGLHYKFYYTYNCFNVYHQSDKSIEEFDLKDLAGNTFDLTSRVKAGHLYGGYYTDDQFTTPIDEELGTKITPEAGETYYLKEVSENYLMPKTYCVYNTYRGNIIKELLFATAIDDANYLEVGFVVDDEESSNVVKPDQTVYETFTINKLNADGTSKKTVLGVKSFFSNISSGYLHLQEYEVTPEETVKFVPYFVTPDGIKVTGEAKRTINFGDGTYQAAEAPGLTYADDASVVETIDDSYYTPADVPQVAMLSLRSTFMVYSNDSVLPEYTITKVDGSKTTTQTVEEGDYTGTIEYAEKKGYLFAGWYTDKAFKNPADFSDVHEDMTVYAKYISESAVSTSVQKTGSASKAVKLQTTINVPGDAFKEIGFVYNFGDESETVVISKKTVNIVGSIISSILGGKIQRQYAFTANWSLKGLSSGEKFTVTPYWVTEDGTTVTGKTQKYSYYLNIIWKG